VAEVAPVAAAPAARAGKPDAALVAAVDIARIAAIEEAGDGPVRGERRVGDHLGAQREGERVVVHRFACTDAAYRGWAWSVQLSRVPRGKPTVDDVVLLPESGLDGGAIVAPAWVPFEERIRPGDIGVGDVLPTAADDPRLVPGAEALLQLAAEDVDELSTSGLWIELGLGRPRVLSATGRDEAADRWWEGDGGPDAAISTAAPSAARCGSCGFWVRLAGSLGQSFGACANYLAPDDGRVVAGGHGCGAHSEAVVVHVPRWGAVTVEEHASGTVTDAMPPEPLGHS
jgi:hypothetical protein